MSTHFDHVSIAKKANIHFDGKCISYNLAFPDHTRKTIGVILPSSVTFDTESPEIIEIVAGKCRARIGEDGDWKSYEGGQRFHVPGTSRFDIEALEPVHYICHFVTD
ncbi:MAG TPA: pyrimidine/purine nucleoside phosphorylase [Burkholderiaceae bacterium]|nr:pyrimidine/purine nucleoside phosphorylase [Burkholderiaceae bacterium]